MTSIVDNKKDVIDKLAGSWHQSGLEKGDTVLIHSSMSGFLKGYREQGIDLTPADVLDSLILAVGDKGTLIFPTFNFEFTKGVTFDIRNTRSETGALTECARLHKDSVRTGHPLFSFAVLGYHIEKFRRLYNYSAFGIDSPFAKLIQLGGKIAVIDVPGEICMTFFHYVEEMENAPNRYHKIFRGKYIDIDGSETEREYNLYARNLEMKVKTDVKLMEELLWEKGLYKGDRAGRGTKMHVIDAMNVYRELATVIREGRAEGMLYRRGD
jgi:aminoglycoside 3-N-acetyltransferase